MLKAWVDLHGLATSHAIWAAPLPGDQPFDVDRWLVPRTARDFDGEAIGLLTVPPHDLNTLGHDLSARYGWLAELDDDERTVARGRPQDRNVVLRLLGDLPGRRLPAPAETSPAKLIPRRRTADATHPRYDTAPAGQISGVADTAVHNAA